MISVSLITTAIAEGEEPAHTIASARMSAGVEFEAVICDQGGNNTEGWDHVVWSEDPGVHPGFEAARRAAHGDLIVICDSHMRFPDGWLRAIVQAHDADKETFYCTGSTGMGVSKMHGFGGVWIVLEDGRIALKWNLRKERQIHGVIGACYAIGANALERMNGFSPVLGLHGGLCEDLSWRAVATGLRVACIAEVTVAHLYRKSHSRPVPWHEAMFARYAWPLISMEAGTIAGCLHVKHEKVRAVIRARKDAILASRRVYEMARTRADEEVLQTLGCEDTFSCAAATTDCGDESFASLFAG